MLLQVQLTLLQKNFEGGALAPLAPLDPPLSRDIPKSAIYTMQVIHN